MNGNVDPQCGSSSQLPPHQQQPQQKPTSDYKLLVDPCLGKGPTKIYRYNGAPSDPTFPPVLVVKDPRNIAAIRLRQRVEPIELPIPR